MRDDDTRAALQRHWAACDADDFAAEHQIGDPFEAGASRAQGVERMA